MSRGMRWGAHALLFSCVMIYRGKHTRCFLPLLPHCQGAHLRVVIFIDIFLFPVFVFVFKAERKEKKGKFFLFSAGESFLLYYYYDDDGDSPTPVPCFFPLFIVCCCRAIGVSSLLAAYQVTERISLVAAVFSLSFLFDFYQTQDARRPSQNCLPSLRVVRCVIFVKRQELCFFFVSLSSHSHLY